MNPVSQSYRHRLSVGARPEQTFEALTGLEGLAAWWTPQVRGSAVEGGRITFGFDDQTITMAVTRTRPAALVRWTCLDHSALREWGGTELTFGLAPGPGGRTTLSFEHRGLAPSCDCYAMCSNGWDHYLGSLKDHLEGRPASPWLPGQGVPS